MGKTKANKDIDAIIARAKEKGLEGNFFFVTTFERYQVQIETLGRLAEAIKDHGMTVTKEYVKGRENLCVNPAITEYNRTATAANNTVTTLIKIIDSFEGEQAEKSLQDQLAELMKDE